MASGDTLAWFAPQCHEPPVSNYGRRNERNTTSPHPIVELSVGDIFIVTFLLIRAYSGGGVTNYIHFAVSSSSDKIDLETSFERIGDQQQNLDTDGFATANALGDITVPGTSGLVDIVSINHSDGAQMDNLAVGELGRLKIKRIAASPEASGVVQIRGTEIMEQ
jgi:hypothetical protein